MNHYPEDMPSPYGASSGRMALTSDYIGRDNSQMVSCIQCCIVRMTLDLKILMLIEMKFEF